MTLMIQSINWLEFTYTNPSDNVECFYSHYIILLMNVFQDVALLGIKISIKLTVQNISHGCA